MTTIEQLQQNLYDLGFQTEQLTKKAAKVFVIGNRNAAIQDLLKVLPGSVHNSAPCSRSSLGSVEVSGFSLYVKNIDKQNGGSNYAKNEALIVDKINKLVDLASCPLHIILDSETRQERIENVIRAEAAGSDWANRKKADIRLHAMDGSVYNISIKMDNAGHWESSDRYYKLKARYILQHLIEQNEIELIKQEHGHYKLSRNIVIQATEAEARDVIFGNDIENNGCVVVRTFTDSDFSLDMEDPTLTIKCSSVIKTLENIDLNNDVWFLIRNDSTKGDAILPGFRGIRVTAINSTLRRKGQLVVDRECRTKVIQG